MKNPVKEAKRIRDMRLFLDIYKEVPTIASACKKAGISQGRLKRFREQYAEFSAEFESIKEGKEHPLAKKRNKPGWFGLA